MKKGVFVGLLIGLLILGLGGFYWWQKTNRAWVSQKSGKETYDATKLEFEVKEPTETAKSAREEGVATGGGEVSQEELDQLDQEINQLLEDLNLEEEPNLDFNI